MAKRAEKIAISVDSALLSEAERARKVTGESRSALLTRALRQLLDVEARERDIARYVEAYRQKPERSRDVAAARQLARRSMADLPWDDE